MEECALLRAAGKVWQVRLSIPQALSSGFEVRLGQQPDEALEPVLEHGVWFLFKLIFLTDEVGTSNIPLKADIFEVFDLSLSLQ